MEEFPVSKRDKRRKSIASKVRYLNDSFEHDRDAYFSDLLYTMQCQLYDIHNGSDAEYLERVTDLEEMRDYRLTELFLWEQYQLKQAQKQYEEETSAAIAHHEQMMTMVRQKLKARLENQRKRLAEDRSLLNVGTDQSFFAFAANPMIPTTRSAAAVSLSGTDRRTLRRRDVNLPSDLSGLSGTESPGFNGGSGHGSRRTRMGQSDDSALSGTNNGTDRMDLELLKDIESPRGRGAGKSYNGVKTLKNDEGLADLAEISDSMRQLRRKVDQERSS